MTARKVQRNDPPNNARDFAAVMKRQAERRALEGIPPPPGSDVHEIIARMVPEATAASWFKGEAEAPNKPEQPEPEPQTEPEEKPAQAGQVSGKAKGDKKPERDEALEVDTAPEGEGGYALVPDGLYEARLLRCSLQRMWARHVWVLWWVIVEGDYAGIELPQWMTRPAKASEGTPRRGWAVSGAYAVATGRRPPRNIARLRPSVYLENRQFVVRVVAVARDQFGADVPKGARYSRVKCLVEPSAGRKAP